MNPMELIKAMFGYGLQMTVGGLQGDADQQALIDNMVELDRARVRSRLDEGDGLMRANIEAGKYRMGATALEGQQRLSYAMGSIDSTSGTAAQTMASSRIYAELNQATARNNAMREALGHRRTRDALDFKERELVRSFKQREAQRTAALVNAGVEVGASVLDMAMGGGMGGGA